MSVAVMEHEARVTMAAAMAFMSEGDNANAERVLSLFLRDWMPRMGMDVPRQALTGATIAIALQLGDAEVFRSLAGELATSEG